MFIQWTDAYNLGIPSIDGDHKMLVDIVNHFFARAEDGTSAKELESILNDVVDLAEIHFKREEALLDRHNYGDLASHSAQHDRTILQLRRFVEPYKGGSTARELTVDKAQFLARLVLSHIIDEDLPCKPYLKKLA